MHEGARILVTGASGFIAKRTILALLASGYRVRGTVRSAAKGEALRQGLERAGGDAAAVECVVADLLRDDGWAAAMDGCDVVLHMASPFPNRVPKDNFALVDVAKGGTVRVLSAANAAGIRRVIVTSSVAAIYYGHDGRADPTFTEADWSNVDSAAINAYAVSKTLAERAAWAFAAEKGVDLTTLNPSLVLGPLLDRDYGTSVELLRALMSGRLPVVPRIALGIVDVRDVADAHVRALQRLAAVGRRFILNSGTRDLRAIGRIVGEALPSRRWRLPKATMPDGVVRFAARFLPEAAQALPELGRSKQLVASAAEEILGVAFRSPETAIVATAKDLAASAS